MVLLHEGAIASATAAWAILLDRSAVARKRPNSRRLPLAGVRKPLTKTDLYVLTRTDAIAAIGRTAFEPEGSIHRLLKLNHPECYYDNVDIALSCSRTGSGMRECRR